MIFRISRKFSNRSRNEGMGNPFVVICNLANPRMLTNCLDQVVSRFEILVLKFRRHWNFNAVKDSLVCGRDFMILLVTKRTKNHHGHKDKSGRLRQPDCVILCPKKISEKNKRPIRFPAKSRKIAL